MFAPVSIVAVAVGVSDAIVPLRKDVLVKSIES